MIGEGVSRLGTTLPLWIMQNHNRPGRRVGHEHVAVGSDSQPPGLGEALSENRYLEPGRALRLKVRRRRNNNWIVVDTEQPGQNARPPTARVQEEERPGQGHGSNRNYRHQKARQQSLYRHQGLRLKASSLSMTSHHLSPS